MPTRHGLNPGRALLLALILLGGISLIASVMMMPGALESDIAAAPDGDPGYEAWKREHQDARVVIWGRGDLNADSRPETVIIYAFPADGTESESTEEVNEGAVMDEKRWMTVIVPQNEGFWFSEPERAPVSNQQIEFKDIDSSSPCELIISGSKGSEIGYAVYRIHEESLENLFAEDMDKCCQSIARDRRLA